MVQRPRVRTVVLAFDRALPDVTRVDVAAWVTDVAPAGSRPLVTQRRGVQVVRPARRGVAVGVAGDAPPDADAAAGVAGGDGSCTNGDAMYTTPDDRLPAGAGLQVPLGTGVHVGSPPTSGSPHVTTAPASVMAAPAPFVANVRATPWSGPPIGLEESPPRGVAPQVTTEPSRLRAKNDSCVHVMSVTPPDSAPAGAGVQDPGVHEALPP